MNAKQSKAQQSKDRLDLIEGMHYFTRQRIGLPPLNTCLCVCYDNYKTIFSYRMCFQLYFTLEEFEYTKLNEKTKKKNIFLAINKIQIIFLQKNRFFFYSIFFQFQGNFFFLFDKKLSIIIYASMLFNNCFSFFFFHFFHIYPNNRKK